MSSIALMRLAYAANVLVAGWVGGVTLFAPGLAPRLVFQGACEPSSPMRVTGALWLSIAVLSACGLARPEAFAVVFLIQLIYKGLWLAVVALPAVATGRGGPIPWGMAGFFAVWVFVLPWVVPWRAFFGR